MKLQTCLLPILVMSCLLGFSTARFRIVEPFPENVYGLEFTSAQVTCVASDLDDPSVKPREIKLMRKNRFAIYTEIKPDGNIYFSNRSTENGSKLYVTMHITNLTLEHDSVFGELGRYECHAFAVGDPVVQKHGFSVNIIRRQEMPIISIEPNYNNQSFPRGVNATLTCQITHLGNRFGTALQRFSWLKNGKRWKNVCPVRYPDPNDPDGNLDPLVLENISGKDSGTYTCLLEVRLRNLVPYNVTAETTITGDEQDPERIERMFAKCREIAEKRGYEIFAIRKDRVCATSGGGRLVDFRKYGVSTDCITNEKGHGIGITSQKSIANFVYTR